MIIRKSTAEIEMMANAGRIVAETIALLRERVRPGVSTGELDELAEDFILSQGGVSSFKGYRGYPAAICTSPNDMVVHGIPNGRTVSEGDILSVDVGVVLDGFVADSAFTFAVQEISADADRLLEGCQAALATGIAQCRAGNRLSDVSHAIQVATEEAGNLPAGRFFHIAELLSPNRQDRLDGDEPDLPARGQDLGKIGQHGRIIRENSH
jgi:methionyl aminopeptidase